MFGFGGFNCGNCKYRLLFSDIDVIFMDTYFKLYRIDELWYL